MHGPGLAVATHPDPAVQLLLDRAACHDLLMRYACGVDRRDFAAVESCFVPDVQALSWGFDNRDAMMDLIRGVAAFDSTMHMMANQFIEIDGDEAAMDTYAMLTHVLVRPDGRIKAMDLNGNRYIEKLRRIDGRWVIVQRGGDPVWAPRGVSRAATDDAAVRWLLDRDAVRDAVLRITLDVDLGARDGDVARLTHFLDGQLIRIDGNRATSRTAALITERDGPDDKIGHCTATVLSGGLERTGQGWVLVDRDAPEQTEPDDPPSHDDPLVRWLIDRAAIADLVTSSAAAMDAEDPATLHFTGNQVIDIDGDEATAETYAYFTDRATGAWGPGARRLVDRFERGDMGWQLAHREVVDNRVREESS